MQQTQDLLAQQQQQQQLQQQQQQQYANQQNGQIGTGAGGALSPTSIQQQQQQSPSSTGTTVGRTQISGGRFDFEDGGTYCGGWEEGKAHGHGVCTGPKHQGAYAGSWNYGFEVSGVYIWPSGSSFEGQWQNGRRHGLGVETRGRWVYRGEWTSGTKGRYGVRQSASSTAKYEGTWASGLQDGYGSETYADGGSYQGQWQEGKRHGYGVRTSAPFGLASHYRPKTIQTSMTSLRSNEGGDPAEKRNHRMDDVRGGFVLKAKSDDQPSGRRNSLVEKTKKGLWSGIKLKKQRSTGDLEKRGTAASGSIRSTVSTASWLSTGSSQSAMSNKSIHTDSNASFTVDEEQLDPSVTETYMGEWKRDKRDGYGISERSDGLKYDGEWHNNKKHGYGVTTFRDGTKEEGKYKYNVLITSQKKKHLFLIRSAKFRERIEAAVSSAQRASKYALQKADIAVSRTATARGKAEMADGLAAHARIDTEVAVATAREFAPDFKPQVLERFERIVHRERFRSPTELDAAIKLSGMSAAAAALLNSPTRTTEPVNPQQQVQQQPLQQSIRRSSLLQKQASVDYPGGPNSPNSSNSPTSPNNPSASYASPNISSVNTNYPQQQYSQYSQAIGGSAAQQQNYLNTNQMSSVQQSNQMYSPSDRQAQQSDRYDQSQNYSGMPSASNATYPQQQMYEQNQPSYDLNRRSSRPIGPYETNPQTGQSFRQSSIDHFDHYKRPPSRDSSVDRYARATNRMTGPRQSSIDRSGGQVTPTIGQSMDTPERTVRAGSAFRQTPSGSLTGNGTVMTGMMGSRAATPVYQSIGTNQPVFTNPNQPFEDVLLRQRTLGQDIIPSPREPKRTESLFMPKPMPASSGGSGGGGGGMAKAKLKSVPIAIALSRKKSMPDVQELPRATGPMSREEVSVLGSARREEVRRQIENSERLKANPLLYLVSPQVKDWFSRQQLVMLVLVVNIALGIMFFKMLT